LGAGVLLAVVPLLYVRPVVDRGGYSFNYALDRIDAHWVTVAALVLLVLAVVRTLSPVAGRPGPRSP
ncbi:MAG: hypothetical protein ACR2NH_08805, partial [Solirubrobacteraceae bacterium]